MIAVDYHLDGYDFGHKTNAGLSNVWGAKTKASSCLLELLLQLCIRYKFRYR